MSEIPKTVLPDSVLPAWWRHPLVAKVPEITALFWVIKVLTTGMGEAASDYLAGKNLVLAGGLGLLGLVGALVLQLRSRAYSAPVYWGAVAMVAVFGTMAADIVHVVGVPYIGTTICWALVLATTFWLWHRQEGTLSIHSISTRPREAFYWATVLSTFALGTAAGDMTADELHLGYLPSAVLFAVLICLPAIGWWRFGLSPVVAFWSAYVLTRPLGASVADWLGKPAERSGVGLGDGPVALAALAVIVLLVGYLTLTRSDVQSLNIDPDDAQDDILDPARTT